MRALFLTRYGRLGASSRLRTFQYLPVLRERGWICTAQPLFSDRYVQALYQSGSLGKFIITGYYRRIKALFTARQYDLVWIEKELFPFLPAIAERLLRHTNTVVIVDYDDALFHRYDRHRSTFVRALLGRKIDAVMRNATVVVAGNRYLKARAEKAGARRVEIVPTVVDRDRYSPRPKTAGPIVIGWIGSPATSHYLQMIAKPLAAIQRSRDVRVLLIGSGRIELAGVDIEVLAWKETQEVSMINSLDIGLMPLPDDDWARGKCGYKLIQYMACARPVVASPIGVNTEIVKHGENGFLAEGNGQWEAALTRLIEDDALREDLGAAGRLMIARKYSLQVQAPRLANIFEEAVRG